MRRAVLAGVVVVFCATILVPISLLGVLSELPSLPLGNPAALSALFGAGNALVPDGQASPAARGALAYALARIGTPYVWGGTGNGGFDCSGLVMVAYASVGVNLPRTAQEQFDAGPALPPDAPLLPGDLVFFGDSSASVDHVGMVLTSTGTMVDAPHTGAEVRVESFPTTPGSPWGDLVYLGATRPAPEDP
jgi:hypothetical protein